MRRKRKGIQEEGTKKEKKKKKRQRRWEIKRGGEKWKKNTHQTIESIKKKDAVAAESKNNRLIRKEHLRSDSGRDEFQHFSLVAKKKQRMEGNTMEGIFFFYLKKGRKRGIFCWARFDSPLPGFTGFFFIPAERIKRKLLVIDHSTKMQHKKMDEKKRDEHAAQVTHRLFIAWIERNWVGK